MDLGRGQLNLAEILEAMERDRMSKIGAVSPLEEEPPELRMLGAKVKRKRPTSVLRQLLGSTEEGKAALKYTTPAWVEI